MIEKENQHVSAEVTIVSTCIDACKSVDDILQQLREKRREQLKEEAKARVDMQAVLDKLRARAAERLKVNKEKILEEQKRNNPKIIIPMITRIMPMSIYDELLSCQPMQGPIDGVNSFECKMDYEPTAEQMVLNQNEAKSYFTEQEDQKYRYKESDFGDWLK